MKAAVCYAFGEPLRVEEVEIEPPAEGEVKVRLAATAVCHSDIHYMQGAWGGQLPMVFGHESAGVVEEVGPGVERVRPGGHVVVSLVRSCGRCYYCQQGIPTQCQGAFPADGESRLRAADGTTVQRGLKTATFAEYTVVDQSQVIPIPPNIPLDSASLLGCGVITGVGAVTNTAGVEAGRSVVVVGAGGVGLNAVQGAALSGASPILALDTVDMKLDAAKRFGATHAANITRDDARALIRELTAGRGADYVFVAVGNTAAMEQGLRLVAPSGALVLVGMPDARATAALPVMFFAMAGQRVLGSFMGTTRPGIDIPRLVDLYRQGRLKLDELITARYPLERINEAIAAVERGEALRNVIVFG
jgi:NDMA-dependent alcohol dehydrogenase